MIEFTEEHDRLYPRIWYVHKPTGTRCFKKERIGWFLDVGSSVATEYDKECRWTLAMEASLLGGIIKDGKVQGFANSFFLKEIDFLVTGKMPTRESLALWEKVTP